MKRTRLINILALFINLGIVGCFFAGFYFKFLEPCTKDFNKLTQVGYEIVNALKNFTFLSATVNMIASLCMVFANSKNAKRMRDRTPKLIRIMRFVATTMAALTLVLAIINFAHAAEGSKINVFIQGSNLYFNLCIPLASIAVFVFLEIESKFKFRMNFAPLIATLIYSFTILGFMFVKVAKGDILGAATFAPHSIFLVTKELIAASTDYKHLTINTTISLFVVFQVLAFVLPILLWTINRLLGSTLIGYEYVQIDDNNAVVRPIVKPILNKKLVTKEDDKKVKQKEVKKPLLSVYHVSVHDHKLRNWKVVLPNKEIKVFATQQEALSFASDLALKNKGIVKVHTFLEPLKFNETNN